MALTLPEHLLSLGELKELLLALTPMNRSDQLRQLSPISSQTHRISADPHCLVRCIQAAAQRNQVESRVVMFMLYWEKPSAPQERASRRATYLVVSLTKPLGPSSRHPDVHAGGMEVFQIGQ